MAEMRHPCLFVVATLLIGCSNKSDLPEPLSNKQADDPCDPGTVSTATGSVPPVDAGSTAVLLPGAAPGIGFDDLRYSATLARILVPAGRSGQVRPRGPLVRATSTVGGFSLRARTRGQTRSA